MFEHKKDAKKDKSDPHFRCDRHFSLLRMDLIQFSCVAIVNTPPASTCQSVCGDFNAHRIDYDDFMSVNATRLLSMCGSVDGECQIEVKIVYNFVSHKWESNGRELNNITWLSQAYPQLRDMITVCGFNPLVGYQSYNLHYCTQSSTLLEANRTDFFNAQLFDMAVQQQAFGQGFYFCANDTVDVPNLKVGTFSDALLACDKRLMTPAFRDGK